MTIGNGNKPISEHPAQIHQTHIWELISIYYVHLITWKWVICRFGGLCTYIASVPQNLLLHSSLPPKKKSKKGYQECLVLFFLRQEFLYLIWDWSFSDFIVYVADVIKFLDCFHIKYYPIKYDFSNIVLILKHWFLVMQLIPIKH